MRVAIVGGGKMGEALVKGLLASGMLAPTEITVSDVSSERREALRSAYGVRATDDNAEAVTGAGVVVIAVKPQQIDEVLGGFASVVSQGQLVISIAAGVTTAKISGFLAEGVPVVRAMPNTAAQLGKAMTAVSAGRFAGESELATAVKLLSAIGDVLVIDETLQNSAVAINGSGPAYFYLFVDALIEAGVAQGLSRADAAVLAKRTMEGAAAMLVETSKGPRELINEVASPGGTTVAALEAFEAEGLRATVSTAVAAAVKRAGELG